MPTQTLTVNAIHTLGQTTVLPMTAIINANIGETVTLTGTIAVRGGGVLGLSLCNANLANINSAIVDGGALLSSDYGSSAFGVVNTNVALDANPLVFATSSPGQCQVVMTGSGCSDFVTEAVSPRATITVASPTITEFKGRIPPDAPQFVNKFFSFESAAGVPCTITFSGITNTTTATMNYGFLQIVTRSIRTVTLADNTERQLANTTTNSLDAHDEDVMSPTLLGIAPGQSEDIAFQDAPAVQVVAQWRENDTLKEITSYSIDDSFSAYLMVQSQEAGAQWVPISKVNWGVRGVLRKANGDWTVDAAQTQLQQPDASGPVDMPTWTGTAQAKVLAEVSNNCYQSIVAPTAGRRNLAVRY